MRRFTRLIVIASALMASATPSRSFEEGDASVLRQSIGDALARKSVDKTAIDALIAEAAAQTGLVPLDFFEGTLKPIKGPITLSAPNERRFVCSTDVEMDPPVQPTGSLQESEERFHIVVLDDGRRRIVFDTVDAESTVGFIIVSDGETTEVEEFSITEKAGEQRYTMREDGSMEDAVQGLVLDAGSTDMQAVTRMASLAARANPFWFGEDAKLSVGEGYLEDELLSSMMESVGQIAGAANDDEISIDTHFFRYVLTGMAEIKGAPQLAFQGALQADIKSQKLGITIPISAEFVQLFDADTALQSLYISRMDLKFGDMAFKITQTQTCRAN